MSIYGKILGFVIGFIFLKLPGAIIGLIVGHMFDVGYAKDFSKQGGFARFFSANGDFKRQAVFFHALFSSLGHISKADGKVTPEEIAVASTLMDNMKLSGELRAEAQQAFRDGKARDFPLQEMLKDFVQHCHGRSDIMQVFLEILISAACADGRITQAELNVLEKVAASLGFSRKDLHFLITSYEAQQRFRQGFHKQQSSQQGGQQQGQHQQYSTKSSLADAYSILGASERDDDKTIKRAYKKQMSLHHPDKLSAKGLPPQALELAKSKTQDIQAAYELVKNSRGF
ncbi:MAG: co-chaperone DjlA [Glaciecola sp.]